MQLTMDYHNTNNESGSTLRTSQKKAAKQQDVILDLFYWHPEMCLTPFEVQTLTELKSPITSIRRAITNLAEAGKLIRTDKMRLGIYGKQNHTWKLA